MKISRSTVLRESTYDNMLQSNETYMYVGLAKYIPKYLQVTGLTITH